MAGKRKEDIHMNMKPLEDFVKRAAEEDLKIEGLYVLLDGAPVFEHRWTPDQPRNIYSHTKSFVSTAVGIAVDEDRISLSDRLIDCFPEKIPEGGNPGLEKITLEHLLTMSSGFGKPYLMNGDRRGGKGFPDYTAYMMAQPVIEEPGEKFCYSTADSILIGRMLESKLGCNLSEFMYDKVLKPMDIPFPIWECCPQGHPVGGGGMHLALKEMAKLGQLYLGGGVWNGRRIVSEAWIKAASSKHMDTPMPEAMKKSGHTPDPWHCGYGYQFWMCPFGGAYRADGAFGQITIVYPEKQMVISYQCPENGEYARVQKAVDEMIREL